MRQLPEAVHDLASEVLAVLREGGRRPVLSATTAAVTGDDQEVGVAAVRVVGADVLLPSALFRRPPAAQDVAYVQEAVRAFPSGEEEGASAAWTHWAMRQALWRQPPNPEGLPRAPAPAGLSGPSEPAVRRESDQHAPGDTSFREPDAGWVAEVSWQRLTQQLALLGALAVPPHAGGTSTVARLASRRPVDLARGFVRAVRRRNWLQAAGAGRWLALIGETSAGPGGGAPASLGLDAGLDFVSRMGEADPRVALHTYVARALRSGDMVVV